MDAHRGQLLGHRGQEVLQEGLEASAERGDEAALHAKQPPEESVPEHEVAEEGEGAYFAEDGDEDHGGVGHALHVANIRPKYMENLQKFHHLQNEASFGLIVGLPIERTLDVLIDLHADLLAHPPTLPSLQQLDVERISHAQTVLDEEAPATSTKLPRDELFYQ